MSRIAALIAVAIASATIAGCGGSEEDPAGPDAFFGVVPVDVPTSSDFARMADGGVGSYRLVLAWSTVEATKGSYDWSSSDAVLGELARTGIEPITTVVGTPAGYAPLITDPPTSSEATFDAWSKFLEAAALRYGPDGDFWQGFAESNPDVTPQPLHVWEIWNEPNTALFWTPQPDPDAYATLLKRSSRVIQGVDPGAEIMTGGMFATPQSDGAITSFDFLDDLYAHRGMVDVIDAIGVHPYGPDVEGVVKQLDDTRETIDGAGDDAATWVTELGWGSDPHVPNDLAKSPDQQAELLRRGFTLLSEQRDRWNLQGVVWFTWHDSVGPVGECVWCATAGLLDADRDSKPAWLAFTDVTGGAP